MSMKIVLTAQLVTLIHKTGLNIDESEVSVLPVHLRETRLVSFETRHVSRDGGNLLLSGTVSLGNEYPIFLVLKVSVHWHLQCTCSVLQAVTWETKMAVACLENSVHKMFATYMYF